MEFAREKRFKRTINLTPLIDIIFLLVVFFLLTSKFVTAEIVDLNLSTVEKRSNVKKTEDALIVALAPGGKFILFNKEYPLDNMTKKISQMIEGNKARDIVLTSQKGVTVQDMVTAMDQIKASGGYNISLSDEG